MCSKAEEKSKVVCKVCGSELKLTKKEHYVVADNLTTGTIVALVATEEQWYDAFDCPVCGCQYIAGERKRKVRNVIFRELQEDLVSDNVIEEDSFDALDEPKEEVYDINPNHTPSCFGKELSEADEECLGCEHLTDCFNAPECFGKFKEIIHVEGYCTFCNIGILNKCQEISRTMHKEELLKERDEAKAYPICIGDQAIREEDNDDCQMCSYIDECTRKINEYHEQKGERWEEPMEMPNEF